MDNLDIFELFDNSNTKFTYENFLCIIGENIDKVIASGIGDKTYCSDINELGDNISIICNDSGIFNTTKNIFLFDNYGEFFNDLLVDYQLYLKLYYQHKKIYEKLILSISKQDGKWTEHFSPVNNKIITIDKQAITYFLNCIANNKLENLEEIYTPDLIFLREKFFISLLSELFESYTNGIDLINKLTDFRYVLYNNKNKILTLRNINTDFEVGLNNNSLVIGNCLDDFETVTETKKVNQKILTLDIKQNTKELFKNIK